MSFMRQFTFATMFLISGLLTEAIGMGQSAEDLPGGTDAGGASSTLNDEYEALDRNAKILASQYRKLMKKSGDKPASAETSQLLEKIQTLTQNAFRVRQEIDTQEVAALRSRVEQLSKTVESRAKLQRQIVERRVADLLNPLPQWDSDNSKKRENAATHEPTGGGESVSPAVAEKTSPSVEVAASEKQAPKRRALLEEVSALNAGAIQDDLGLQQPWLTDNEVIAAIRWLSLSRKKLPFTDQEFEEFRDVAELRSLPENWSLRFSTEQTGNVGSWHVYLYLRPHIGSSKTATIRKRYHLVQPEPPTETATVAIGGTRLDDAVRAFNSRYENDAVGKDEPPLSLNEVLAAIHSWDSRRDETPVTTEDFKRVQRVAETHVLPAGWHFEVLTGFQPDQDHEFTAWSVRLVMPQTGGGTYAFIIRDRWIDSKKLREEVIRWGVPGANGIQVGLSIQPQNEHYATGQKIVPRFYYRNTGSVNISIAFPRIMTHSYYDGLEVTDGSGTAIPIVQDSTPSGPVGWIQTSLQPGSRYPIWGLPMVLDTVERTGGVETVIMAKPGQSCRVSFLLPNYAMPGSPPLKTGECEFIVD